MESINIKELPEVLELDGLINTYVHYEGDVELFVNIQRSFWKAIEAIQKSIASVKDNVTNNEELLSLAAKYANLSHEDFDGNIDIHFQNGFFCGFKVGQRDKDNGSDGWISVKDDMPNGEVLLLTTSKVCIIGDFYKGQWRTHLSEWQAQPPDGKWELVSKFKFDDITHWQPLPSPPKQ